MPAVNTLANQPQTEMLACVLCGSDNDRTPYLTGLTSPYSAHAYAITRCGACSNLQTTPYPTEEELNEIYADVYNYDAHICIINEKRRRAQLLLRWISNEIGDLRGKKLLEIGCMFGNLLEESAKLGIDARGVELNSEAAAFGRSLGLNIECAAAEQVLPKSDWRPDIVVLSHVLEHVRDPEQLIKSIRQNLGESALLVIAVPNNRARLAGLLGKAWAWWQVPVHLNHFNESTLNAILNRSGFKMGKSRLFCGDSLMFLLSALNCIGLAPKRGDSKEFSPAKKLVLSSISAVISGCYPLLSLIFDDEIAVIARPKN